MVQIGAERVGAEIREYARAHADSARARDALIAAFMRGHARSVAPTDPGESRSRPWRN